MLHNLKSDPHYQTDYLSLGCLRGKSTQPLVNQRNQCTYGVIPVRKGNEVLTMSPEKSRKTVHPKVTDVIKFLPDRLFDRRISKKFKKHGTVNTPSTCKISKNFFVGNIFIVSHKMPPARTVKRRTPSQEPVAERRQPPGRVVPYCR